MASVSFDLDGVIMRGPFASAVQPRLRAHFAATPALAHLAEEEAGRRSAAAVQAAHWRRLAAGDLVGAWNWDAIYTEVARSFGGPPVPDVSAWVREGCRLPDSVALLTGARAALERLRTAGLRVIAITNGYRVYQWPVLEHLGLADLFEDVLTPEVTGFAKPDPRMFRACPDLVAHVGDTLLHDVLGANLADVASIWIHPELPPDLAMLPPAERPREPAFGPYLAQQLEQDRYRPFHPEASVERCTPTAVACDADEAAQLVLAWNAPSRS
jgi:putative hydrolase of the HAD superfamily